MKTDYAIGIDPGTTTGIAIWDCKNKKFQCVYSSTILDVMRKLEVYAIFGNNMFYIENPNLRKWYGKNSNDKLQGAGSIKRDYSIWLEWFHYNKAKYQELNPKNITTKINSQYFKKITGWNQITNHHSRDAAMIVFNI